MTEYEIGALDRSPADAVVALYRTLRHAMDDALQELHLTTPQWTALKCIAERGEMSGAEIARLRHVTPQTMHAILLNLEQNGLIVREPHPSHNTVLRVSLTDEGRSVLEETMDRAEYVQGQMLRALDVDERTHLLSLLERCMASLQSGESCPRLRPMCEE
jgi:DNA-binding MarR family transcriptional regulator